MGIWSWWEKADPKLPHPRPVPLSKWKGWGSELEEFRQRAEIQGSLPEGQGREGAPERQRRGGTGVTFSETDPGATGPNIDTQLPPWLPGQGGRSLLRAAKTSGLARSAHPRMLPHHDLCPLPKFLRPYPTRTLDFFSRQTPQHLFL